jgi:hypothetical protein
VKARPLRAALAGALTLALFAGRAAAQTAEPPPSASAASRWGGGILGSIGKIWNPETSPFIPIPEIGTDPNSGTTYGLLPVFLTTRDNEISRIYAPDVIYNPTLGNGGHFRVFSYPSRDAQWALVVGAKQRIERELDAIYSTGLERAASSSQFAHLIYDRSATERFFGIGNRTSRGRESNYTFEQGSFELAYGWNFSHALQIALSLRPRFIEVERGALTALPSTETAFPGLPGLGKDHELFNRLFLTWNTRDNDVIPRRGSQVVLYGGLVDRAALSSTSYRMFGLDARHYVPISERITLAAHGALQYMPVGDDVPFWALSRLGGDRAIPSGQQLLRGFGEGRFVDKNMFSASVELRGKIFDLDLFSTRLAFEVAPFVDVGRVFRKMDDNPVRSLHKVGGVGFRGVASPFIVGYVDLGYGSEGTAIFSGLDYAF